jgi:PleD family two-component response regulator
VVSVAPGEAAAVESLESLLRRADAALYVAKNAGRNRVESVEVPRARAVG